MLEITIPPFDLFNEEDNTFTRMNGGFLQLEHSLISLSKWEQKWHKSFLEEDKTVEEMYDYIRCMTLNKGVSQEIYTFLPSWVLEKVADYIKDPMCATTITTVGTNNSGGGKKEKITAEIIYYWMISFGIPVEFEKWHLNRLLMLIKVIEIKNSKNDPKKNKLDKKTAAAERAKLNKARRKKYNSKG